VSLSKEELEARVKRLEELLEQLKRESAVRARTTQRGKSRAASFVRPKAQPEDRR
jgi:cell division septal protein FtsQ